jgi:hypothetical protein
MLWEQGTNVVKVACPAGCDCDGKAIPITMQGTIISTLRPGPKGIRTRCMDQLDTLYYVQWADGRLWWTYRHGLACVPGSTFPYADWGEDV